ISIVCSACQQTIRPYHLFYHKKAHKARTLLGIDSPQRQTDNKTLLAQRQKLISKLTKTSKYSEICRQKIDCSFELLMDNHTPTSDCILANVNDPRTFKKANNSLIKALSVCQDKNSTWQRDMEDRFIVVDNYGNRSDTCFLGLVDGSHGVTAAETVASELPLLFLDQLAQTDSSYKKSKEEQQILDSFATVIKADYREKEKIFSDKPGNDETNKTNTYEWIHKAYAKSFWRMDRLLRLGRNEVSKVRWSGCSAVTCLVERTPSKETDRTEQERKHFGNDTDSPLARTAKGVAGLLHVANIGNAHAVLCRNGKGHRLSKEHSTSNISERNRILQNGGNISTNEPDGLVEGYLRTTRGLGHHGDPVLKRSVIPVPHTVSVPIDDTCQFLILASNGLWEVLDYSEVLALTLTTFTHYLRMYEGVEQNGTSYQCQYLMPLTEDNLNDSEAINNLQDETEIQYSNEDISLSDSKGNLKQNKPRCSRRNSLQNCKVSCDKSASYAAQELLKTLSPEGSKPPPQFEEDTKTYSSNCKSEAVGRGRVTSETLYDNAASYISEQLVKTALAAGSRDNITILIVLLNGCHQIP
ncbi:Protein phosphatase 2C-like domain-containing protein 1, partial [Buceros rhinoceros silvestris]